MEVSASSPRHSPNVTSEIRLTNTTEPWTPPLQQCKGSGPETCFSSVRQSAGQSETNVSHGGGADSPKQLLLGSRIVTFCQLQRPSDVVTICQLHRPSKSKVNNYEATEGLSSGRLLLAIGRVSSVRLCLQWHQSQGQLISLRVQCQSQLRLLISLRAQSQLRLVIITRSLVWRDPASGGIWSSSAGPIRAASAGIKASS